MNQKSPRLIYKWWVDPSLTVVRFFGKPLIFLFGEVRFLSFTSQIIVKGARVEFP